MSVMRTAHEIVHLLGLRCPDNWAQKQQPILGYRVDSRLTQPGDLFFALPGCKMDGHQFLAEAARHGAVAAVVRSDYRGSDFGMLLLRVEDVLASLHLLAKKTIESSSAFVVGITGSVGKTTTKEMLAAILSTHFVVGKTPGNCNSQTSFPLALLELSGREQMLVLEMGMTEAGEIARLAQIAPPRMALITRIGFAHLENFSDGLEGVARAKAEIFVRGTTEVALLGGECWNYSAIQESVVPVKRHLSLTMADVDYSFRQLSPNQFQLVEGRTLSPTFTIDLPAPHFLENAILAIAAARELHLSWEHIQEGINHFPQGDRRFELTEHLGAIWINDCYNASYDAMMGALAALQIREHPGRKIAILGKMPELGVASHSCHRAVGAMAANFVDELIAYGEEALPLWETFCQQQGSGIFCREWEELVRETKERVQPGDLVLLKGANSLAMWRLLTEALS